MSFVARFLEWLVGPIVFLALIASGLALTLAWRSADIPYDNELEDMARAISTALHRTDNPASPLALTEGADILLRFDRRDTVRWAVRKSTGEFIAGDADVPPVVGAIENGVFTFQSGLIDDEPVRVVSLLANDPAARSGEIVVQVAETLNKRHWFAENLRTQALLPQLLVLIGSVFLVWYGLGVVVKPMMQLRSVIDSRGSTDLRPLDPAAAPAEIQPLVESINGLMRRLADNFEAQQRFTADAAHQLRSPLAALALQTEQALAEQDPERQREALAQVVTAAHRIAHLANRLLALARAGTPDPTAFVAVDLVALARTVVAQALPAAATRRIDLGMSGSDGNVRVDGEAVLLREMLANLVDNALRYTPAGGSVTVTIGRPAFIEVGDTGPGVPEADRQRVFEPFVRGADNLTSGTGLGLAIVRTIAQAHGARVTANTNVGGCGALFRVDFRSPAPL